MGSCAAPSAKGDDKFITTDYLQQCRFICRTAGPDNGIMLSEIQWHNKMLFSLLVKYQIKSSLEQRFFRQTAPGKQKSMTAS
jgi:hypothetical protein